MRNAVLAAAALVALVAAPTAMAAGPAPANEMGRAARLALTPSQAEGLQVDSVRVSAHDPRFGVALLWGPNVGRRVAVMARGRSGWRVLDVGGREVGCGLMGARALADLGLRCPAD